MKPRNKAIIRVCASCECVYIFGSKKLGGCPTCGFGSYGSVWAVGWKRTLWGLLTRCHR